MERNEDTTMSESPHRRDADRDALQQRLLADDLRKCANNRAERAPCENAPKSQADRASDLASDRVSDRASNRSSPLQMAGSSTSRPRFSQPPNGGVSDTSGDNCVRINENNIAKPKPRIWSIDDVVGTNSNNNRHSSATKRPPISEEHHRTWVDTSRPAIVTTSSPLARLAPEVTSLPHAPTQYGPSGVGAPKFTWAMDASRCLHPYFSPGFSHPVSHTLSQPGIPGLPPLPFMPMMNGGFLPRTMEPHGIRNARMSSNVALSRNALGRFLG